MLRAILALLLFAAPAAATQDGWPALHDVTGVAAGDVLKIRSGPGASFPVVGTLDPGALDIEVIAPAAADPGWGIVNVDETGGVGYASLRFLRRQPDTFAGHLPPVLACAGTEPFWSARVAGDSILYADLSMGHEVAFEGVDGLDTGRHGAEPVLRSFEGGDALTVVLENLAREEGHGPSATDLDGLCSDGMSDALFGMSATVVAVVDGAARAHHGCCSFQGR